jgi:hypothetical protein
MSGFTLDIFPSKLGGGLPGGQPKGGLIGGGDGNNGGSGMEGASTRARDRNILRKAFGNHVFIAGSVSPLDIPRDSQGQSRWRTSPFRVAENAGDILGTVNMHPNMGLPGGYNQVNGIGPSRLHATKSANGVKKSILVILSLFMMVQIILDLRNFKLKIEIIMIKVLVVMIFIVLLYL